MDKVELMILALIGLLVLSPFWGFFWLRGGLIAALFAIIPGIIAAAFFIDRTQNNFIAKTAAIFGTGTAMDMLVIGGSTIALGVFIAFLPWILWNYSADVRKQNALKAAQLQRARAMLRP